MTDYENKDLTGQVPQPEASVPESKTPEDVQPQAQPVPQLTLDPDPVVPETVIPEEPVTSAQAFQMPAPPQAPEPPHAPEAPQTPEQPQAGAPQYAAPQYGAPQYGAPQYGAPQPPYQNVYYYQQPQRPLYNVPPAGYVQKSRLAAGLLAILLGALGIHNFYLGFNARATIQLVVTLATCGIGAIPMAIWGFVEGVLILTASNPSRMYDGNGVILGD